MPWTLRYIELGISWLAFQPVRPPVYSFWVHCGATFICDGISWNLDDAERETCAEGKCLKRDTGWRAIKGDTGKKQRFCKTAQINYFSLICSIIEPQWEISSWRHPYSVFRMAITSYGRWSHASEGSISMSNNGQLSGSNTKSKRLLGHECKGRFILNCI